MDQEEQIAMVEIEGDGRTFWWYVCEECHSSVIRQYKFCPECGRRLIWEGT